MKKLLLWVTCIILANSQLSAMHKADKEPVGMVSFIVPASQSMLDLEAEAVNAEVVARNARKRVEERKAECVIIANIVRGVIYDFYSAIERSKQVDQLKNLRLFCSDRLIRARTIIQKMAINLVPLQLILAERNALGLSETFPNDYSNLMLTAISRFDAQHMMEDSTSYGMQECKSPTRFAQGNSRQETMNYVEYFKTIQLFASAMVNQIDKILGTQEMVQLAAEVDLYSEWLTGFANMSIGGTNDDDTGEKLSMVTSDDEALPAGSASSQSRHSKRSEVGSVSPGYTSIGDGSVSGDDRYKGGSLACTPPPVGV